MTYGRKTGHNLYSKPSESEDTFMGTSEVNEKCAIYQSNPLIEARKPLNALEMRLFLLAVEMSIHISLVATSTMTRTLKSSI